ncbi:MAG: hemolysin III family protein [Balneolaceae bacterium]|nr:MAG: hemolysin III family protein [Balneolaceae bacterium]
MAPDEKFNSYTHLAGAIGSLFGGLVLLYVAVSEGDPWKIISYTVFGITLITLYTCSALYHSFSGRLKKIFQKLDHISIYLLIAGTYTPFTLVTLRGEIGWIIFGLVWGFAAAGIIIDLIQKKGKRTIQLFIYLLMGWLAIFAFKPLMNEISIHGLYWLVAGGLFYTSGVLFYVLSDTYRYAHGIWHLFVLAGSFSHFITILHFV